MAALTDRAIERIREKILTGELVPGQRLPPEKQLGEELGVSRNSLREAVKALELMRVLDVRQGDGTYVTSLEPAVLSEVLGFVLDLHSDDALLQIFEVRRLLEPHAAALAASHIDEAALESLDASLDAVNGTTSVERLITHDLEFHRLIAAASGNPYLAGLLDAMAGPTARARIWRGLTQDDAVTRTIAEHRALLEAIRGGDADLARSWAAVHIQGLESWLRRVAVTLK